MTDRTKNTENAAAEDSAFLPKPAFSEGKKKRLGLLFWVCMGWIVITTGACIFANFLHIQDPNPLQPDYFHENAGPSLAHWFGLDALGRDIFSRVLYGGRVSIEVGFATMSVAFLIGGTLGMLAAYRRGKFDLLISSMMYTVLAFPGIIFVIAILAFWQPRDLLKIVVVISIASIPIVYRVIRGATLSIATRDFVLAAKVQGATTRRIMLRELFPNVFPVALSFYMIGIAIVIGLEGALSFLGISVDPTVTVTWGNLISSAQATLAVNPWLALFPSLALCLFLLALNFGGDRIRAYFDVSEIKL